MTSGMRCMNAIMKEQVLLYSFTSRLHTIIQIKAKFSGS